jgi:hypothetical protein
MMGFFGVYRYRFIVQVTQIQIVVELRLFQKPPTGEVDRIINRCEFFLADVARDRLQIPPFARRLARWDFLVADIRRTIGIVRR